MNRSMLGRLVSIFALFSVGLCTFGFHSDRVWVWPENATHAACNIELHRCFVFLCSAWCIYICVRREWKSVWKMWLSTWSDALVCFVELIFVMCCDILLISLMYFALWYVRNHRVFCFWVLWKWRFMIFYCRHLFITRFAFLVLLKLA